MSTPDYVPAPSPPATRGSGPVLPYAGRGVRSGGAWTTVYEAVALAVLAAIAVPVLFVRWNQYQGPPAGTVAHATEVVTCVQSLRAQVRLFKEQHNDRLPGVCPLVQSGGPFNANEATFWAQMTQFTDVDGNVSSTKTERYCYGPYMQSVPANRLNGSNTIASAPARGVGFVYDFAGGAGSGKVWGVDRSGALIQQ